METYDVIVNQPVVIDNVSGILFGLHFEAFRRRVIASNFFLACIKSSIYMMRMS